MTRRLNPASVASNTSVIVPNSQRAWIWRARYQRPRSVPQTAKMEAMRIARIGRRALRARSSVSRATCASSTARPARALAGSFSLTRLPGGRRSR